MPGLDYIIPFLLAACLFAIMPGPAMLYAAAQTLSHGRGGGLKASLGMHIGGYAHVFAAAFGLSALLTAIPPLYLAMKLLGAAYLIWLGWRMIRQRTGAAIPTVSPARTFLHSIAVEVLNPKSALFYLAFLPQFADPGANWPIFWQLVMFGAVMNLIAALADVAVVLMATVLMARLRASGGWQTLLRRLGGGTLIGLGTHLALSKN